MTRHLQRRWFFRPSIAILAITAMLAVSAASTSASHIHTKAPAGQCDICFTLHVVSSEAVVTMPLLQAPEAHQGVLARQTIAGYRLPILLPAVDRGPPSL